MWKDQKKIISWREMRLKAKKNHFTSGINVELYMIFKFEYISTSMIQWNMNRLPL